MDNERRPRPVISNPAVLGGTPVFAGTRVPAQTLLDHLIAGDGVEAFLEQYPPVSREQAVAALEGTHSHWKE